MFDNFRADVDRYVLTDGHHWLYCLLTRQGLWATAEYRYNRWVHTRCRIPVVRQVLKALGLIWHKMTEIITGIELPEQADIGKGLYIGHFGNVIVGGGVKMGVNCSLSQDVTIGQAGRGDERGSPIIGDRVYVAPGARVIGKIKIGSDVAIGANAVVTKDLPDGAVAVGVPAKVVSLEGSGDFIACR